MRTKNQIYETTALLKQSINCIAMGEFNQCFSSTVESHIGFLVFFIY